jgi:leucyl aminopeptidase
VNAATLTGAIKVGLGSQVAGLFSNRGSLAKELFSACGVCGEDVWPMPLYQKYRAQMHSPFADMVNAVDGFGGAITAALFLESFVNDVPWAHLDIYAWKDAPEGAVLEPGGSGQGVQGLVRWLKSRLDV